MKKFQVEIVRHGFQAGVYELEAPDEDAAYVLAQDISLDDPRIEWEEDFTYNRYPRYMDIGVHEKKE